MITFSKYISKSSEQRRGTPIRGVYAHGDLERDLGYDMLCICGTVIPEPGIHACSIDDLNTERKCVAFIWREYGFSKVSLMNGIILGLRGIVFYDDDISALKYATEHYANKSMVM